MKTNIKKGDLVQVLSGKDKGRQGKVLAVLRSEGRALVEGVNMVQKHRKPRGPRDQGGIVPMEAGIYLSKLALVSGNKPTRLRIERGENGERRRVSVKTGETI